MQKWEMNNGRIWDDGHRLNDIWFWIWYLIYDRDPIQLWKAPFCRLLPVNDLGGTANS